MSTTVHFDVVQHRVPCQHIRQYARATSQSEEDELFLAVNQYVPRAKETSNARGIGITIIACHANGAPKELYEPLWDNLYEYMQQSGKTHILNIFIADIANQGESGMLNENKIGNEASWYDDARDCLGMVNHFRKDMKQPIVGFGHSLGGTILLNVALMHPRLFATVINFEASACRSPRQFTTLPGYFITFRKDRWPSRAAAMEYLAKHPLYKTWDVKVLELFCQYGLRDLPTSLYPNDLPTGSTVPVTLTTTKHQEITDYTRAAFPPDRSTPVAEFTPSPIHHPDIGDADWRHPKEVFYRPETTLIFAQLQYLRPSCLWLYGADTTFTSDRANRQEKTRETGVGIGGSGGASKGRVKELEIAGGGHYMPLEAPRKVANEGIGPWLDAEMARWIKQRNEERREWESVDIAKRNQVSDDFLYWMKKHNDPRKVTKAMRQKL